MRGVVARNGSMATKLPEGVHVEFGRQTLKQKGLREEMSRLSLGCRNDRKILIRVS
jgi:hypothetical protein